jgi:hypothetical protein
MPVICPTCQILFSKNDFAGNATRPRLDMRSKDISRELMAKYRIDIGRNFSMLVAMTAAAQTRRGLGQVPTQSVNLLDCRLKTANVLRHGLSIRLISHLEEVHGRN